MSIITLTLLVLTFASPAQASPKAEECLRREVADSVAPMLVRNVISRTLEEKDGKYLVTVDASLYTPDPAGGEAQHTGTMSFGGVFTNSCEGGAMPCGASGCSPSALDAIKRGSDW